MANIKIKKVSYHRNGSKGTSFQVVKFKNGKQNMIAIQFNDDPTNNIAILDLDMLSNGVLGYPNSWRSDCFESEISKAINDNTEKNKAKIFK